MCDTKLTTSVSRYFEIAQQIAQLEREQEEIKEELKGVMIEQGTEELEGVCNNSKKWRATWHTVTTTRFDTSSFKKNYNELYVQFSKASTTTRFTLNEVNK